MTPFWLFLHSRWWSSVVICGHPWWSVVIRGGPWSSVGD